MLFSFEGGDVKSSVIRRRDQSPKRNRSGQVQTNTEGQCKCCRVMVNIVCHKLGKMTFRYCYVVLINSSVHLIGQDFVVRRAEAERVQSVHQERGAVTVVNLDCQSNLHWADQNTRTNCFSNGCHFQVDVISAENGCQQKL